MRLSGVKQQSLLADYKDSDPIHYRDASFINALASLGSHGSRQGARLVCSGRLPCGPETATTRPDRR